MSPTRTLRWAAAFACAAALAGADAAPAADGAYLVQVGKLSTGAPTGVDPGSILVGVNRNEGSGGLFGVEAPARFEQRMFTFHPPAHTTLVEARIWAHARAYGWPAMGTYGTLQTSWGDFNLDGQPGDVDDDRRFTTGRPPLTATTSTLWATAAMPSSGAGNDAPAWFLADKLDLVLRDDWAPELEALPSPPTAPFGPTRPSGWHLEADGSLTATVSDRGSGVRYLVVRHEGVVQRYPIVPESATCRTFDTGQMGGDSYTTVVPCPTGSAERTVPVDLAAFGDGEHAVEVGVQDAAGNRVWAPLAFTLRVNLPGGALPDPGTTCRNGTHDDAGTCVKRAPSNLVAPSLDGTARVGETLSVEVGSWADVEEVAWGYRWQRCDAAGEGCVELADATEPALALGPELAGATVRVAVTATTDGGVTTAVSPPSDPIAPAHGTPPDDDGDAGDDDPGDGGGGDDEGGEPGDGGGDADEDAGGGGAGGGGAGGVVDAPVRGGGGSGGGGGASGGPRPGDDADAPTVVRGAQANGRPASASARLSLRVAGPRRLAWGTTAALEGALVDADGRPIADAALDVIVQRRVAGAAGEPADPARTDEDGTFRVPLPAGPSRVVTVGYRERLSDDAFVARATATVETVAPVRLTVDRPRVRNGEAVRFRGTVGATSEGTAPPARLQVRVGRRWRTLAEAPVDAAGAWRGRYRFQRTRRATTYRFRLVVGPDRAWPFARSASPPVAVRVRGDRRSAGRHSDPATGAVEGARPARRGWVG